MKKNNKIHYLSSLTGSGKSEHIIEKISFSNEKYLVVTPNRELCDEIFNRIVHKRDDFEPDKDAMVIHQITHDSPSKVLKQAIEGNIGDNLRILVTTQAAFLLMINRTVDVSEWNLILDEEMPVFVEHEINVTKNTKSILENTLDFQKTEDGFYNIGLQSPMFGMNLTSGVIKDSFLNNKPFRSLVENILSDKYDTKVSEESLEFFDSIALDEGGKKFSKFYAISIMRKEILFKFKSILVLCSFFERTITYKLLKHMGCELVPYNYVPSLKEHTNTENINIHYFFDMNWSTTLRKTKINKKKSVEELVYERIKALVGQHKFLYNANVNFRQTIKGGTLAASTHGINKYKTYTEMVFMPSLNATSATVKLLSKFGMKRSEIDFARNVLTAYQFASRGAIRDPNNTQVVNLYVMDKRTAKFLKSVFKHANVVNHSMDGLVIDSKVKKKIPNNIKSFMSRVKKRLNEELPVREATLKKYQEYLDEYYNS